jgi:hypothetical protein
MGRVRKPRGLGCGIPAYDRVVILRCTSKLLAVIGPALAAKPAPAPDAEDWYANLLWFDRRKCLLLTHAATLFSIFEPNVSAPGLRATGPLVSRLIERELACEGLPSAVFAGLEPRNLILAKTADGDVGAAWDSAAGVASDRQWLTLADLLSSDRPADALPVYLRAIEPLRSQTGHPVYQQVAAQLSKIQYCHQQLGTAPEFVAYLAALRADQKRKRNLIKLLD